MGDHTFDRILHDLKVVASLRPGERLCVYEGTLQKTSGLAGHLWRFLTRDGRAKTLALLNSLFSDAFVLAEFALAKAQKDKDVNGPHEFIVRRAYTELQRACLGLKNLKTTYLVDVSMQASLDILREKIRSKIIPIGVFISEDGSNAADGSVYTLLDTGSLATQDYTLTIFK